MSAKKLITDLIKQGFTHVWNDCDAGLSDAISRCNYCASYTDAESELAGALGETVEEYRNNRSQLGSYEQHHTYIYDLREEINYLTGRLTT